MATKRVSIDRIRNLIRIAEGMKKERIALDMSSYEDGFVAASNKYEHTTDALDDPECGTTCCVLGRAGLDPYFRRRGVRLDYDSAGIARMALPGDRWHLSDAVIVSQFLGITQSEAEQCFYGENERTPTGKISKTKTLNRVIRDLKAAAKANHGVEL